MTGNRQISDLLVETLKDLGIEKTYNRRRNILTEARLVALCGVDIAQEEQSGGKKILAAFVSRKSARNEAVETADSGRFIGVLERVHLYEIMILRGFQDEGDSTNELQDLWDRIASEFFTGNPNIDIIGRFAAIGVNIHAPELLQSGHTLIEASLCDQIIGQVELHEIV